jgi:hypothetical protein
MLVTNNIREFERIPGLRVENWTALDEVGLLDEILERHGLRGRWDQWTKGPHV